MLTSGPALGFTVMYLGPPQSSFPTSKSLARGRITSRDSRAIRRNNNIYTEVIRLFCQVKCVRAEKREL
jgi:hypothetical protein